MEGKKHFNSQNSKFRVTDKIWIGLVLQTNMSRLILVFWNKVCYNNQFTWETFLSSKCVLSKLEQQGVSNVLKLEATVMQRMCELFPRRTKKPFCFVVNGTDGVEHTT